MSMAGRDKRGHGATRRPPEVDGGTVGRRRPTRIDNAENAEHGRMDRPVGPPFAECHTERLTTQPFLARQG
jgi:hypothetical protein